MENRRFARRQRHLNHLRRKNGSASPLIRVLPEDSFSYWPRRVQQAAAFRVIQHAGLSLLALREQMHLPPRPRAAYIKQALQFSPVPLRAARANPHADRFLLFRDVFDWRYQGGARLTAAIFRLRRKILFRRYLFDPLDQLRLVLSRQAM